jgi:hypothetical protein
MDSHEWIPVAHIVSFSEQRNDWNEWFRDACLYFNYLTIRWVNN